MMEDEVDLRLYVRGLLKHWKLIALLAVLGAIAGLAFSVTGTASYGATALVTVGPAPYGLDLEGITQPTTAMPTRNYPDIARSDQVVEILLARLQAQGQAGELTPRRLAGKLQAEAGTDPALMRLTVTDADPDRAVLIANAWAQAVAEQMSLLFGPANEQVASYDSQLAAAHTGLTQAEQALADFQTSNDVPLLRAELDSQQLALTGNLVRQRRYELLLQDGRDLLARLQQRDPAAPASMADETALLLLLVQASGAETASQAAAPPVQLQIGASGAPSSQTVGDLFGAVTALNATIAARLAADQAQVATLQQRLLELQGQLAEARLVEAELVRVRNLAETQYMTLADKVSQVKIAAQDASLGVRVASNAAIPRLNAGPSRLMLVAAGGLLGLTLGLVLALALEWWRGPSPAVAPVPPPSADVSREGARA